MLTIPFNRPYITGHETGFIAQCIASGKLSGDGVFTKKCQAFFEETYGFKKCLLTSSCTDALEMSAILLNIGVGDEIIVPSYTFVSSVNAFILRGATVVFADSSPDHPNIDPGKIEELITPRTKALVIVHYAGVACDMAAIMSVANKHGLFVIEDAAQAIDAYFNKIPLGSIGDMGTFSFHDTKNVVCGEGGMISVNNQAFNKRAEIIRDKGTNRSSFLRGEVNKYEWMDIGSSFLPSDITSAFLYGQLQTLSAIQERRLALWSVYNTQLFALEKKGDIKLPFIPDYAVHNASIFYIICRNLNERERLSDYLKKKGISTAFHFLPLHKSKYYNSNGTKHSTLPYAENFGDCLLRLPLYVELSAEEINYIVNTITLFFKK